MKIPKTNSLSPKQNWLFMFLLLLTLIVFGCNSSNEEIISSQEKREKEKIKEDKIITEFTAKYGAILDWDKELLKENSSNRYRHFYTIDLQKAVMETKEKPVVLKLRVKDIYKDEEKVIATFKSDKDMFTDIFYDLECNDVLVKKITTPKSRYSRGPKVLVIATLKNAFKLKFGVTAYPDGYEDAELEIEAGDVYKIS